MIGKNRWGFGVVALYGGFALFTLGIVIAAAMQSFDLVEPEYYSGGLAYQQHIDKVNRTRELPAQPVIRLETDQRRVQIEFPDTLRAAPITGTITLFRPSAASLDFAIPLTLDAQGIQTIDDARLLAGYWKLRLTWRAGLDEYYVEKPLIIAGDRP